MKVAVIGSGVMGPGIAQVFLMGGHDVVLTDIYEDALMKGSDSIQRCLALMQQKGLTDDAASPMEHLTLSVSLAQSVVGADLVVEAVPEVLAVKQTLYEQLDAVCPQDAVIVSNTSAFPLPEMMPAFRPRNFFVAHFFNPPAVVPLVEIVHNARTDIAKVEWLRRLLVDCGKKPVVLSAFVRGFLINRLQTALVREGLYLVSQGVVSPADLDTAVSAGIGFKTAWQGFFETMDFIGLDTVAFACGAILPDLCTDTGVPAAVTEKVAEGKLGLKTKEGFLSYPDSIEETERGRLEPLMEQLKLLRQYS